MELLKFPFLLKILKISILLLLGTGSIVVDKKNNNVWVSVLAFGYKGQIYKYDITNKSFKKYDLGDLPSPVGITINEKGNIWVSDHGTSIFVKLNPINSSFNKVYNLYSI